MVIITGKIKLDSSDEVERVIAALRARAARSRNDAGNIDYVFCQNIEDSTEIHLVEKWDSEDALNAHLQIPDEAFSNVLATAQIERAIVSAYDASNERELMKR